MELHTAALFNHKEARRITGTNDGDPPGEAPRLYLGRTGEGHIWRIRDDLPDDVVEELVEILQTEPLTAALWRPPATLSRLSAVLTKPGQGIEPSMGPAFRFPSEIPVSGGVTTIDLSNIELVKENFPDHLPWLSDEFDIRRPITAIVRDGAAVSICFSARMTSDAAEAGVDTINDFRGQGFAPQVVAAWASAVRRMERIPLYSTSWNNEGSQRVASKLNLVTYGSEVSIY
jgi:RimJ/RimL family protein N-acetyltransferase